MVKKNIPTVTDTGETFVEYMKLVEKRFGPDAAKDTRRTALKVMDHCVKEFSKTFGSGLVGAGGDGGILPGSKQRGANITGLLYGNVQSGKTAASMAAIACGIDNGFRCIVVLTSDNTLLGNTIADDFIHQLFGGPVIYRWSEWHDDPEALGLRVHQENRLTDTGAVFITTKNTRHLQNLITVLRSAKAKNFAALVLDDEADNASLDTNEAARARGAAVDPGATYSRIGDIRSELEAHVYLQVTATPQSLFLQTLTHPCKPAFCVLTDPGAGYIGGTEFFAPSSRMLCQVAPQEFDDLRGGKVHVGPGAPAPRGLRDALAAFLLGCAQKNDPEDESLTAFSFLAHIAIAKVTHEHAQGVIDRHMSWLERALRGRLGSADQKEAEDDLRRGYDELKRTAKDLRPLADLTKYIVRVLVNARAKVINSDTDAQQVHYTPGPNIFVGGNRLSRGVRIKNLMVTYYGREAKTRMMDTVHQHARMFGYRAKLKDVLRFYSTKPILDAYRLIWEADQGMREAVGNDPDNLDLQSVWVGRGLQASRANVLNPIELGVMAPGRQVYPWCPKFKAAEIKAHTVQLDEMLAEYEEAVPQRVEIEVFMEILALMPSQSEPGWPWEDGRIQAVLDHMRGNVLKIRHGMLLVQRPKPKGKLLSRDTFGPTDTAYGPDIANAKTSFPSLPTLIVRRTEGKKVNGWDDQPFWAPTLVLPNGKFAFMFSNA